MLKSFRSNIEHGYNKMIRFETKTGGYEWFGKGAGHETLTSYGLQIFKEIDNKVDPNLVDKTTQQRVTRWLQSRKVSKPKELYSINSKAIDTFGRSIQEVSDAYIVYTLSLQGNFTYEDLKDQYAQLE